MSHHFDGLRKIQGPPFWLEINSHSLQVLCTIAKIGPAEVAVLIGKSESLAGQLLAGETGFVDGVCKDLGDAFCFWPLQPLEPNARPLCQLTPRSLKLMRKGQKFTRPALVTATGISKKYLQSLEDGSRGFPGKSSRDALSQALGFQFFLL